MKRQFLAAGAATLIGLSSFALASPAVGANGGRPLTTQLTGEVEVPNAGDPDGEGIAKLRVNPGQGRICYTLKVTGIEPAAAAHIHEAPAGEAGPVVAPLEAPGDGSSSGCVEVERDLALDIIRNPENYYVNVHNPSFPGGALRGQLG